MYINIIYITLGYKHVLCMKVIYTSYFINSSNIYTGKTLVFNSGTLSSHLSINKRPYYNSGLFLNKSIDPTSIGL